MRFPIRTALMSAIVAVTLGAVAAPALAADADKDTKWQKSHPRREQVNNRLANQNKRIRQERKEGEISKAQARQLHGEDHAIRQEERTMASTNGGHVTKAEQKSLNQQENQVSKQIGK
ncbi:MAG TPA: hypothetical protein VET46_11875 [Steroidobacteraceae bacterium]|nr:hypothetical protein [Steroidobacteraceae bacterium]